MSINKKNWWQVLLVVYIIASLGYIAYSLWQNVTTRYAQESFAQGQEDAINQLITQANTGDCKPFSVYNEDTSVELLNTACLKPVSDNSKSKESNKTNK